MPNSVSQKATRLPVWRASPSARKQGGEGLAGAGGAVQGHVQGGLTGRGFVERGHGTESPCGGADTALAIGWARECCYCPLPRANLPRSVLTKRACSPLVLSSRKI